MSIRKQKYRTICSIGVCILLTVFLSGCTSQSLTSDSSAGQVASISTAKPVTDTLVNFDNMVDERFELLSLVFRLAGHEEYCDLYTDYQQSLETSFRNFSQHAAVQYAAAIPFGYDAVFNFSVHLVKDGDRFIFIENIDSLVEDGRWTQESAAEFLPLLNQFYVESGFAEFYQSNMDFYIAETQWFVDGVYSQIDLDWFKAYVNPENLRCIYSPSSIMNNYGATVNDLIVYASVSADGIAAVHEFCHSFANPIAHKWYAENAEFAQWCEDTIDPEMLPSYGNGEIIAGEYVTLAYNALYYADHGYAPISLLIREEMQGFPYIEDVYAMITDYDRPDMSSIESILGVQYEMGEEQSFSFGDREVHWKVLTLAEPLPMKYLQTEVGNIFDSKTGDVLYIASSDESTSYLYIDLGEATYQGQEGYRSYSRIPIES